MMFKLKLEVSLHARTRAHGTFLFTTTLALLCLSASPAQAAFNVCNRTAHDVSVAFGRFDGTEWLSEGWWPIAARHCTAILPGRLVARYYYLYASDGGAGLWSGSHGFCVKPSGKFQIIGRAKCAEHGYDRKSFFEVDTGSNPDWVQSLSD